MQQCICLVFSWRHVKTHCWYHVKTHCWYHVSEVEVFSMTANVYSCEPRIHRKLQRTLSMRYYATVLDWTVSATVCAWCQHFESLWYNFCAHGVKICITSVTALRPRFQISQIWRFFFQFETIWYNLMWTFFEDMQCFQCCNAEFKDEANWTFAQVCQATKPQRLTALSILANDKCDKCMLHATASYSFIASCVPNVCQCVEYVWVCHEHIARCLHGMHTMLARLSIQITHWAWQNVTTVTTCDMHYMVAICMLQFFPLSSFRCPACALPWASEMFLRFCFRNNSANSANGCYEVSYLVAGHRL